MVIVLEFKLEGIDKFIVVFKIDKFGNLELVFKIDVFGKLVIDINGNTVMVIVMVLVIEL